MKFNLDAFKGSGIMDPLQDVPEGTEIRLWAEY
jgi:hypothetical protein